MTDIQNLPLNGLKVVAIEQYGAGPFGTQHLADLGASVIKVENFSEGGDVSRSVGPQFFGNGDSLFFEAFNRNKQSIGLNLKHPECKAVLHRLTKMSDAVFNNLRGDLPAKLGLDYAALSKANEQIVCVHLSAYGRDGSRANWPGYDYLMQAEAGYLSLTGEPEGPPARMGLSIIDLMTGTTAAMALLAGIVEARALGKGRDLDVSLFDVALHNLAYLASWYLNNGTVTGRLPRSSHPSLTPSQLYRTRDGWIFLMCNKQKFWERLVDLIGHPELASDPAFANFKARLENRPALTQKLDAILSQATTDEWISRFAGEVPSAPIFNIQQALESDFVQQRELIAAFEHATHGPIRGVVCPVRTAGTPSRRDAAPALGAHTDSVLKEAGFSTEAIMALRNAGAIG